MTQSEIIARARAGLCLECGHTEAEHSRAYDECQVLTCKCDAFVKPESLVRVGVAVLVWRGSKLLYHLRKGKHGPGTWSFPGGNMDWGEEPAETAERELREECGPLKTTRLVPWHRAGYVNTVFPNGRQYITLYFTCELLEGEPQVMEPEKCERWEWFDSETPPQPLFDPLERVKLFLA